MGGLRSVLAYHLTGLTRFAGREPRGRFWPWIACVLIANMAAGMIVGIPIMVGVMTRLNAFAAAHPDRVSVQSGPMHYEMQIDGPVPPELIFGDMRWFFLTVAIVAAFSVLLLAAAVLRRLHDSGRGGWWGLLPLPFLTAGLIGITMAFEAFGSIDPDFTAFALLFVNNIAYLGTLGLLVVQLCRPGDPGPNRFGPVTG